MNKRDTFAVRSIQLGKRQSIFEGNIIGLNYKTHETSLSVFNCKDVNECTPFETKNGALVASRK